VKKRCLKWWKEFCCWLRGHDDVLILDCDARRSFNRCTRCGYEFQYDFQAALKPDWIGFCDPPHQCPLCFGWKPRDWDRCAQEVCEINPDGMMRLQPDGSFGPNLDSH